MISNEYLLLKIQRTLQKVSSDFRVLAQTLFDLSEEIGGREMGNCNVGPACTGFIDCLASQATFKIYVRNADGSDGAEVSSIDGSLGHNVYVSFIDCEGNDLTDDVPVAGRMQVSIGTVSFEASGSFAENNKYHWTPDLNGSAGTAVFSWGTNDAEGELRVCSKNVVVSANVMDELVLRKTIQIPQMAIAEPNVTAAVLEQMTAGARNWSDFEEYLSIVFDTAAGQYVLRARHEPNNFGSPHIQMGGSLPNKNVYRVSQKFRLQPGFDFGRTTQRGKIGFGLAGGGQANGFLVSGGTNATTGHSLRPGYADGRIISYSYHANRPSIGNANGSAFGAEFLGPILVPGQIHTHVMQQTMNDPGVANGKLESWLDGQKYVDRDDILWMTGIPEIDFCIYSDFHGGNSIAFAPLVDTSIDYFEVIYSSIP